MENGAQHTAGQLAEALPPLLVAAQHLAAHLHFGAHARRKAGLGEDFWQYRPARPGDALADIDWRRSGRGDDLFIRQQEWQAAQKVAVWCDTSAAMRYTADPARPEKLQQALILTTALALVLERGGEGVFALGSDAHSRRGARQVFQHFAAAQPVEDFGVFPPVPSKVGAVVGASDFLGDAADVLPAVQNAIGAARHGVMFQVVDPTEVVFPFSGRVVFKTMQGNNRFEARKADALQAEYAERFAERTDTLRAMAGKAGWGFRRVSTDEPLMPALVWAHGWLSGEVGR